MRILDHLTYRPQHSGMQCIKELGHLRVVTVHGQQVLG